MNNLPNPYQQKHCQVYRPLLVAGEKTSLYINFDNPINYAGFADLRLVFIQGNTVTPVVGAVLQKDIVLTGYNIYMEFTNPSLPEGVYQLGLQNTLNSQVVLRSNQVQIISQVEAEALTVKVKFRSSRSLYKYGYSRVLNFYNEFRLSIFFRGMAPEEDIVRYVEVSTGYPRLERSEINRTFQLQTYKFDEDAHEAMIVLLAHDSIVINGKKYMKKDSYEIDPPGRGMVSNGTVNVYDIEFGQINKY